MRKQLILSGSVKKGLYDGQQQKDTIIDRQTNKRETCWGMMRLEEK